MSTTPEPFPMVVCPACLGTRRANSSRDAACPCCKGEGQITQARASSIARLRRAFNAAIGRWAAQRRQ